MRTLSVKTTHGMWSDYELKKLLINFLHHYLSIKSGRFPDVGSPRHLSHRFNWIFVCLSTDECTNLAPGTSSSIKFAAIVYLIVRNDNSASSDRLLLIYAHKLWRKLLSMLLRLHINKELTFIVFCKLWETGLAGVHEFKWQRCCWDMFLTVNVQMLYMEMWINTCDHF